MVIVVCCLLGFVVLSSAACDHQSMTIGDGNNPRQGNRKASIIEVTKWIQNLRWRSVAIMCDGKSAIAASLTKALSSSLPRTTWLMYDFIHGGIRPVLHAAYRRLQPHVNIVLLCRAAVSCWSVLDEASRCDISSNRTSDFRHQSKWIVLGHDDARNVTLPVSIENVAHFQLVGSSLDSTNAYSIHATIGENMFPAVTANSNTEQALFPNLKYGLNNRTLVVSTLPSIGILEMNQMDKSIVISGPVYEILETLATVLNFSYLLQPPTDKEWGQEMNGTWNGMTGQLQRREVDMVAADLSVHEDRIAVMDFVMPPIMYNYVDVMYKKVDDDSSRWLLLAKPFKLEVFLIVFLCGFLFQIVYRITLLGTEVGVSKYGYCYEMLWFTVATILKQDLSMTHSQLTPKSCGSRVLVASWWLFLIVMVSIYSANLAAGLSVVKQKPPFSNLMELVGRKDYTLGMPIEGVNYDLFKTSPREDVRQAWARMKKENETNPFIMSTDYDAHYRRVQTDKHVVFMYSHQIKTYTDEDCRLAALGEKISWQQSAFGVPLHSPLKGHLENAMGYLVASGILQKIFERRNSHQYHNRTCEMQDLVAAITTEDLLGAIVVVGGGVVLSVLTLMLELLIPRLNIPL